MPTILDIEISEIINNENIDDVVIHFSHKPQIVEIYLLSNRQNTYQCPDSIKKVLHDDLNFLLYKPQVFIHEMVIDFSYTLTNVDDSLMYNFLQYFEKRLLDIKKSHTLNSIFKYQEDYNTLYISLNEEVPIEIINQLVIDFNDENGIKGVLENW